MPTSFLYKKHNYFISNSFYLYISNFADYMIMLIFIPFIARKIGAVEFGKIGVFIMNKVNSFEIDYKEDLDLIRTLKKYFY